jgi:flagellar motor switch protein FliM
MAQILSQDEVDALLNAVNDDGDSADAGGAGEVEGFGEVEETDANIQPYDLTNQGLEIKKYWDVYDAYNQPKLELNFEEAKK